MSKKVITIHLPDDEPRVIMVPSQAEVTIETLEVDVPTKGTISRFVLDEVLLALKTNNYKVLALKLIRSYMECDLRTAQSILADVWGYSMKPLSTTID